MNDYNYGKLRLSLKVVSLQICLKSSVTIAFLIQSVLVFSLFCSFENSVTEETHINCI